MLFTDLADYTESVRRSDRQAIRDLIAAHESSVADVLTDCGGRVVKNIGDSFMTLFDSATDAVRAGLQLVKSLKNSSEFKVRVGIATGDIEHISEDYFGDAVNLASRILSKCPVEEVWFSESTLLSMNQAEVAFEVAGGFRFKGFFGDMKVYRAIPDDQVWLPKVVEEAASNDYLVVIKPNEGFSRISGDSVVLLLDCPTGNEELEAILSGLPVISPSQIWLSGYKVPPVDRWNWIQRGSGWVIGTTESIEKEINRLHEQYKMFSSSMTMFFENPTAQQTASITLSLGGLALPRTPLSEVVLSYTYDFKADGTWVNSDNEPILRIEVNPESVRLSALHNNVLLNGRMLQVGQTNRLEHNDVIQSPSGELRFLSFSGGPYAGLMIGGNGEVVPVELNSTIEVGREPSVGGFSLNDRRGQANLRWCSGQRAKHARKGGFTLDRALVGRRQAQIFSTNGTFFLRHLHEHCPTYVVTKQTLIPVSGERELALQELVVTGTSVLVLNSVGSTDE